MPKNEIAKSEEIANFKTTIGMAMSKLRRDVKQLEAELIRITFSLKNIDIHLKYMR